MKKIKLFWLNRRPALARGALTLIGQFSCALIGSPRSAKDAKSYR